MTVAALILPAITLSMFLIVFSLGMQATLADATALLRRPSLLIRSILAMNVVMLGIAIAIAWILWPPPAVSIALVALAVSPVPPILPGKQTKAGGSQAYAIGLLAAASIAAIVLVPASIELVGRIFSVDMHEPIAPVAKVVFVSVILPLAAGILFRMMAPAWADRLARPVSRTAAVMLAIACVPVLVMQWHNVQMLIGNKLLIGLAAFTVAGLAVGHAMGGPDPHDRTVLALATATRHPGVAIGIASLNFPHEKSVLAVVLMHLVLGTILSVPYVRSRRRIYAAQQDKHP